MPLVGNPNRAEAAVQQTRFVAQLYIARRKVWEGRANSYEEASNMAKREKQKYPDTKSTIVIRESNRAGD